MVLYLLKVKSGILLLTLRTERVNKPCFLAPALQPDWLAQLSNPLISGHAKNQSKTLVFGVNYQNFASDGLVLLE